VEPGSYPTRLHSYAGGAQKLKGGASDRIVASAARRDEAASARGLCRGFEARERTNHFPFGLWGNRRPEDLKGERKQRRRGVGEPNSRYGLWLETLRSAKTSREAGK
jgi:hypothetical protein